MSGWKRIVRGMVGTGLVFGAGATAVTLLVGVTAMIFGNAQLDDLRLAGRIGVAGFILGVGFSGMLAVASRSKKFTQLSIPKFASFGALAGLIYFLLISINGYGVWSPETAIFNFLLLTLMGSGAATATLLIARKARGNLDSSSDINAAADHFALGEGAADSNTEIHSSRAERERV